MHNAGMPKTQHTVTLTARKLPAWVHTVVKHAASRAQRSLNGQLLVILEDYAKKHRDDACADGVHVFDGVSLLPGFKGKPNCRCGAVKGAR
jgi:hypothetical protein